MPQFAPYHLKFFLATAKGQNP